MNIHFTDIQLFDKLKKATIAKVIVGSHMYGTNNKNSDIDYLYIYATSENELLSVIQTHHQLQYIDKEGNDHNFVSFHTFIRNILNGDSTINFETIQSNVFKNSELEWLIEMKHFFITYTIIRSYLGLCRRDVKHYYKANTLELKKKRLGHIIRGYLYAESIINDCFDFESINKELKIIIEKLDVTNNNILKEYDFKISKLREVLNAKFEDKSLNLPQFMSLSDSTKFTSKLLEFCNTEYFKNKQNYLNNFDLNMYLKAYENWVKY